MVSQKILVDFKLYLNCSNNLDAVVIDGLSLCDCNLTGGRISTVLMLEAESTKILVDFKFCLNGSNNIDTVDVYNPRVCSWNWSSDNY